MVELIAATAAMDTHAAVGEIADVLVARAGRIDLPARRVAMSVDLGLHHALSRRRAADIAETDEEDAADRLRMQTVDELLSALGKHRAESCSWESVRARNRGG